MDILY